MDVASRKSHARHSALAKRARISGLIPQGQALERLARHAEGWPDGTVISGYLASGSELDPLAFMQQLHTSGRHLLCVPVVLGKNKALGFRQWSPTTELERGTFGIPVPKSGAWLEPSILIVPLLAFDRNGYRLGYGGGFYDRTLYHLRQLTRPVLAVGLGFAEQEVESIPIDSFDQKLDALVTDSEVLIINKVSQDAVTGVACAC
ncbi:MAG: 5-formyltetrahydrofolate cyclo-ligase [Rhodobacteraceae bacterium]|nr:5-formyltetrahydrofolate cyclo-ligase [Paracoccaceae bacterium]